MAAAGAEIAGPVFRDSAVDGRLNGFEALGMMTALAMECRYRNWSIADLETNVLPALRCGQSKIYLDRNEWPGAFITWALVNDECHHVLMRDGRNPPDDRWCAGPHLWFIDIVAPFVSPYSIVRDMQRNRFPGCARAHSIRRNAAGEVARVNVWCNLDAKRKA